MDEKTLATLEYLKILERLASYAAFSLSAELARALRPVSDLEKARALQARTSEARRLLELDDDISIGGARDVRHLVDLANRRGVLEPAELLDVKNTLMSMRTLGRYFERQQEAFPILAQIAAALPPPAGLIDAITRAISEQAQVLDQASEKLAAIRRELQASHSRLLARLERMINDPKNAPMLQEQLITQRNGRYVIPLRAEFKGRLRSIIHDQSSSGATLFIEPLAIVELNNRWHELQLAERDEERRILAELSGMVGNHAGQIQQALEALAELDLALMCAKYADDLRAVEPLLKPLAASASQTGGILRLYQARHPLLDPANVAPIDLALAGETFALVITGPNTGGKTVTLKTAGLLALMAQSGLHIPAQSGSELCVFQDIYADIGDEQSIEQSLSTFSGHITQIVRILERAGPSSLVLLDELGAGTDPQEGAALARALLAHLVERRIPCLVATHYPELKAFAHTTPGMMNASMEFDLQTLRPTYRLTLGLPGRSNALLIAERLGLPQEVLQAARATLDPADLRAEDLLDEIHRQRDLARQERAQAEETGRAARALQAELAAHLEKIEEERLAALEKGRAEFEDEISGLRNELDEVRRALRRVRQPLDEIKPLEQQIEQVQETVQKSLRQHVRRADPSAPLRIGERVRLRALGTEGVISALNENEIEVQAGVLRVRVRPAEIQRMSQPAQSQAFAAPPAPVPAAGRAQAPAAVFHSSPGMELDLRGQRADEALEALDRFLESAYLAGMPFVRIIHGKGTGRLRQSVRQALKESGQVKRWETGGEGEGGEGVTVAWISQD